MIQLKTLECVNEAQIQQLMLKIVGVGLRAQATQKDPRSADPRRAHVLSLQESALPGSLGVPDASLAADVLSNARRGTFDLVTVVS